MKRISTERIFVGGLVVSAAIFLMILLLQLLIIAYSDDPTSMKEGLTFTIFGLIFGSPACGLFCMFVLELFGKQEESVIKKEVPRERVVYVVDNKEKEPKETEDASRYMPR